MALGDVVFMVINNRLELRKVHRSDRQQRITSHVVVRAFDPITSLDTVSTSWSLVRWGVRPWCSSSEVFEKFLRSVVLCDVVAERPAVHTFQSR